MSPLTFATALGVTLGAFVALAAISVGFVRSVAVVVETIWRRACSIF